jgi:hypothetical protein
VEESVASLGLVRKQLRGLGEGGFRSALGADHGHDELAAARIVRERARQLLELDVTPAPEERDHEVDVEGRVL